jgi:hypothetical protein
MRRRREMIGQDAATVGAARELAGAEAEERPSV